MGLRRSNPYNPHYSVEPIAAYQMGSLQPASRRFTSAVGRFFYRLFVGVLIVGALGGVLFALYRNDVLLTIARGAGLESQYLDLERRIGAPGWGTPRSVDTPGETGATAAAAASDMGATATESDDGATKAAGASAPADETEDGLPIVSFDELPKLGGGKAPAPVSLDSLPQGEPRRARPAAAPVAAAPRRSNAKAVRVSLDETPEPKSAPAAKPEPAPKPEPVAKAEPAPEPEPAPAPTVDPTKPRPSDNPLKAAIRAAMAKKAAGGE